MDTPIKHIVHSRTVRIFRSIFSIINTISYINGIVFTITAGFLLFTLIVDNIPFNNYIDIMQQN
jgi:hypothetical protein